MESKEKKQLFLSNLFQHLDGIVLIPTLIQLQKKQILEYVHNQKKCTLSELSNKYNANSGYLNVALRLLCSQGILHQEIHGENVYYTDLKLKEWFSLDAISKYQMINPIFNNDIDYNSIISDNEKNTIINSDLYHLALKFYHFLF